MSEHWCIKTKKSTSTPPTSLSQTNRSQFRFKGKLVWTNRQHSSDPKLLIFLKCLKQTSLTNIKRLRRKIQQNKENTYYLTYGQDFTKTRRKLIGTFSQFNELLSRASVLRHLGVILCSDVSAQAERQNHPQYLQIKEQTLIKG